MNLALSKIDFTDSLAVWRRNSRVYLRLWKTELIAPVIEPVFTFFAFGFGVGALVASKVEGLSYLSFVGAGVLAFTVLMRTIFEMTYGAFIFSSATSLFTPLAIVPLLFGCLYLGALGLAITARIFEIGNFNIFFALFFSTLFMCGAWFPVEMLPWLLQIVAYVLPTTSVINLTRACLTGNFSTKLIYEAFYLFVISVALLEGALQSIRKRMVV